jgi:hypothetical protein
MPGVAGTGVMTTVTVRGELDPQVLFAVTDNDPPADPAVTVMLLVDELPVHPEGSVHVYDVAPFTELTEYVCELP